MVAESKGQASVLVTDPGLAPNHHHVVGCGPHSFYTSCSTLWHVCTGSLTCSHSLSSPAPSLVFVAALARMRRSEGHVASSIPGVPRRPQRQSSMDAAESVHPVSHPLLAACRARPACRLAPALRSIRYGGGRSRQHRLTLVSMSSARSQRTSPFSKSSSGSPKRATITRHPGTRTPYDQYPAQASPSCSAVDVSRLTLHVGLCAEHHFHVRRDDACRHQFPIQNSSPHIRQRSSARPWPSEPGRRGFSSMSHHVNPHGWQQRRLCSAT
uniref:Uncharacterized protein n=1 Tax=Mycena chlorophos TaxID=658473 RepID=A0ABQ0LPQ7_MYCCL|nr:predicted protein [Mycena chlorophos]